ncbi:FecR family protein [Chitinophaga sp. CF418]|uniref:FecR family protein n=1 Tax=Chitinophaga sp. CF418 TaxID=1855287 RepID=UPI00091109EF|nr:FecR family protein [Chitinophaga sp. CF418]SHN36047.1 FecR family protein [Chitinophaga sp. CF418]
MEVSERLEYLVSRAAQNTATAAEIEELRAMLLQDQEGQLTLRVSEILDRITRGEVQLPPRDTAYWAGITQNVLAVVPGTGIQPKSGRIGFYRWWWAAAILCLLAGSGWILQQYLAGRQQPVAATVKDMVIQPGHEGAILTLADGSQIVLDSLKNGLVADQNGVKATKNGQGSLVYDRSAALKPVQNTISTPRGRQFHLILPDGSEAWLNAASSISFPTVFGDKRSVAITGEVYFEVTKDDKHPFVVDADNKVAIQVLGTSFNVKAYKDEKNTVTTLLTGAIKVSSQGAGSQPLKPGQQAAVSSEKPGIQLNTAVDTDKVISWKNGYFNFDGLRLEEVLKQLERWYDIEATYDNSLANLAFYGELPRNMTLNDMIKALSYTGLQLKIEGNKLSVKK